MNEIIELTPDGPDDTIKETARRSRELQRYKEYFGRSSSLQRVTRLQGSGPDRYVVTFALDAGDDDDGQVEANLTVQDGDPPEVVSSRATRERTHDGLISSVDAYLIEDGEVQFSDAESVSTTPPYRSG